MKDHVKSQTLIRPTHEPWNQDQVGRTADWQKLRYSLYSTEDESLNESHVEVRSAKFEVRTWKKSSRFALRHSNFFQISRITGSTSGRFEVCLKR